MSKGSRNRTTDWKAYRKGYERCFGRRLIGPREACEKALEQLYKAEDERLVVADEEARIGE